MKSDVVYFNAKTMNLSRKFINLFE